MNSAIEESWRDYLETIMGDEENEHWAHEYGWKDGAEWVLTELMINKKISEKAFKEYMNKIS